MLITLAYPAWDLVQGPTERSDDPKLRPPMRVQDSDGKWRATKPNEGIATASEKLADTSVPTTQGSPQVENSEQSTQAK
jgi:hypothetical protein